MANLIVYLLKVSNSRRIYIHLRYPGKSRIMQDKHYKRVRASV